MTRVSFFALILFASTWSVVGQNVKLSGRVVDSLSGIPLEYVTISLANSLTGTTTNKEGRFAFFVNRSDLENRIQVNHLGFQKKTIKISDGRDLESDYLISLNPISKIIEEVNVSPQSIPDRLRSAITTTNSSIARNNIFDVYYREFAYLDSELFKFSDAAMHYKITSGDKKAKVETYVLESRIIKDSITHDQKWKTDVESLIDTDKSAKEFSNLNYLQKFVGKNHGKYFDYSMDYENGVNKIHVVPKASVKKYLPSALVYVDEFTNQILRVDYGYDTHLKYMPTINLIVLKYAVKKDWVTNIYNIGDHVFLRYSKITQDIDFKIGKKSGLLTSDVEVLITDIHSEFEALNDLSQYKNTSISKNGNNYSTMFWENATSILPTAQESETIKMGL